MNTDIGVGLPPIPLSPLLVPATFLPTWGSCGSSESVPSIMDARHKLFLSAGRTAFACGLRLANIGDGDEVLLPAYSSPALETPILQCTAKPVFYRVNEELGADLEDVAKKIGLRSRALLGINFFGFAQDWRALRRVAEDAGLILFEDCAHALYGSSGGSPFGSSGDYAFSSLAKFLPVWDGGILAIHSGTPDLPTSKARGLRTQLKACSNLVEEALASGRLPWVKNVARIALAAADRRTQGSRRRAADESLRRDVTGDIDPAALLDAPAWISRAIAASASRGRIFTRRRNAFQLYKTSLVGLPGISMPFGLREGEVPYMVPVWVDDLETRYPRWRAQGVPMQRYAETLWPGAAAACFGSAELSRHLVQFPCHQDLRVSEIMRIIDAIRLDFSEPVGDAAKVSAA